MKVKYWIIKCKLCGCKVEPRDIVNQESPESRDDAIMTHTCYDGRTGILEYVGYQIKDE